MVSAPQAHWTDGEFLDLDRIATSVRAGGAALVIDASQSVGAVPLDVRALRPDFVVAVRLQVAARPVRAGLPVCRPVPPGGRPIEENWILRDNTDDFSRLVDYSHRYQPGARRFDVGARTEFELTPIAIDALEQLRAWSVPRIAATLRGITARVAAEAARRGLAVPDHPSPHMLGIGVPERVRPTLLRAFERARVHVGARGSVFRVSPYLYTTESDVERLLTAFDEALADSSSAGLLRGLDSSNRSAGEADG